MQVPDFSLEKIDQIRKAGFRPQVVMCILHNRKLLFVYKHIYKIWQFPQGGIQNRESPEQTILREIQEELGSDFPTQIERNFQFLIEDRREFTIPKGKEPAIITDQGLPIEMKGKHYFFFVLHSRANTINIKQTEFDDYKWTDYEEALDTCNRVYHTSKKIGMLKAVREMVSQNIIS